MSRLQLTLAILKPDLYIRPKAKEAVKLMIKRADFLIVHQDLVKLTPAKAKEFYAEHTGRFFFQRLIEFMCIHPIECLVLAHPNAIQHWRSLMGPTKPYIAHLAAPHTIRGRYGLTDTRNSTHGSDSEQSAEREISILLPAFDFKKWQDSVSQDLLRGFVAENDIHNVTERKDD